MSTLSFVVLYGVSYGLVLFLLSIGLVVTMGLMRIVNLAHGAFAAIGGYISVSLATQAGLAFPLAVSLSVIAVAALGVVMERAVYVRLYGASELEQVLMTIGLCFIVIGILTLFFGSNVVPGEIPGYLRGSIDLGFRDFEVYRLFVIVLGLAIAFSIWLGFERTYLGAILRAAVDNASMAQATGINVPRLFTLTFALGSGLAALGAAIGAPILPLEPFYPFKYLTIILIIVSFAEHGSIKNAIGFSVFIGVLETAVRLILPQFGAFLIYFVLIAAIAIRHRGIFGRRSAA